MNAHAKENELAHQVPQGRVSQITSIRPETLGKTYRLDANGIAKSETVASMSKGLLKVITINDIYDVVGLLEGTTPNQALCASLPVSGALEATVVVKKELPQSPPPPPDLIARSKKHLVLPFGQPGLMILDYDPPKDNSRVLSREALWDLVCSVIPGVQNAGVAWWCSGSSYIYCGDQEWHGLRGQRLYILVNDLSDIVRAGGVLARRLWLAGRGDIAISKSGAKMIRSTFDESMHEPARFDFSGGAVCISPLEQRRGKPSVLSDGGWLDTRAALPDLTAEEEGLYLGLVEDAKIKAAPASAAQRELWVAEQEPRMVARLRAEGVPEEHAKERASRTLRSALGAVLHGDFEVTFDDGSTATVGTILDNREKFHGRLTRDPLEPDYQKGKTVGKLYLFGAAPNLHSFARGTHTYKLRRQPKRLYVEAGQRAALVDSIIAALVPDADIFEKNGQLVKVGPAGVKPLRRSALAHVIGSRIALYKTTPKGQDAPVDLARDTCEMVRDLAEGFAQLKAYTTLPFCRSDGTVVDVPGYDPATQIYAGFHADNVQPVPSTPSRADIVDALRTMWSPWRAFPFATENDRGAMLAAIISAVCRPSLDKAPGYFFDAPVQGSGKTLCAEALGSMVRGRSCGISPFVGGENGDAEMLKQIVAMLLTGECFWLLDNVVGTWRSAVMSAMLTSGAIKGRILGSSDEVSSEARITVCATGNNASLDKDLARRFIRIRIDSKAESPQARSFEFYPVDCAIAERFNIARAVAVVIRGYVSAGSPVLRGEACGYSKWSALVRQSVLWCESEGFTMEAGIGSCGDPAITILEDTGESDEHTVALGTFLRGLAMLYPDMSHFTSREVYAASQTGYGADETGGALVREALAIWMPKGFTPATIGQILKNRRDTIQDGMRLASVKPPPGASRKAPVWMVCAG